MAIKNFTIHNIFRRRRKSAGFTLLELLVSVAIGWIVISGLIYMVVQMLQTDRKEFALTQTQAEMDSAMDYIATELKEAVYVYERDCLLGRANNTTTPEDEFCQGLSFLPNTTTQRPILAFWKLEQLPYAENPTGSQNLPTDCSGATENTCNALRLTRTIPTLIVYFWRQDAPPGSNWQGPARLTRFQLRAYNSDQLSSLTPTAGYPTSNGSPTNPLESGFTNWPCDKNKANCSANPEVNDQVLVDLVDTGILSQANQQFCPDANYRLSKADETDSFYACVRPASIGQGQDAIVHLRGNAIKRAGLGGKNTSFLPQIQIQVQTRAVRERKPSAL